MPIFQAAIVRAVSIWVTTSDFHSGGRRPHSWVASTSQAHPAGERVALLLNLIPLLQ
jgi:hypothetical protein